MIEELGRRQSVLLKCCSFYNLNKFYLLGHLMLTDPCFPLHSREGQYFFQFLREVKPEVLHTVLPSENVLRL